MVVGVLLVLAVHRACGTNTTNTPGSQASIQPVPNPSVSACQSLQDLHSPTQLEFGEYHLNSEQKAEVVKWVAKMNANDRQHAKWMLVRSPQYGNRILVFSARPTHEDGWIAVNHNVEFNFVTCEVYPYPGA
jgi:hypothetical protein